MEKERVKDYLLEFKKRASPSLVPRELDVTPDVNLLKSIYGPRRSGKTSYFYQLIQELGQDDCLYLNFEDSRLYGTNYAEIRDLIRIAIETLGQNPKYLFFDEIQAIDKWEIALRELYDTQQYMIFVTGSSSKLLSKEIATQLRGRGISYILLPFSFREFLTSRHVSTRALTMDEQAAIRKLLREYLEFGGFPQVVLSRVSDKEALLREYFDLLLFKDVVERHGIRNLHLSNAIFKQLISSFSSEFSVNKMYNYFKSNGIALSKNTLYGYLNYFEDSAGLFFLKKYSTKPRMKESWPKKVYLCDVGFAKIGGGSKDIGCLMENVVFLDLLRARNAKPLVDLYYFRDASSEVDFVVAEKGRVSELLQVTYASSKAEIAKREVASLSRASKILSCKNLTIITWDYSDEDLNDTGIKCTPLWKWLFAKTT